jgi:hypothetical protein
MRAGRRRLPEAARLQDRLEEVDELLMTSILAANRTALHAVKR